MKKKKIVCMRLKGLMAENKKTIKDLEKASGICYTSVCEKINGHSDWRGSEMIKISNLFKLNSKQVFPEYFEAYELPEVNKAV